MSVPESGAHEKAKGSAPPEHRTAPSSSGYRPAKGPSRHAELRFSEVLKTLSSEISAHLSERKPRKSHPHIQRDQPEIQADFLVLSVGRGALGRPHSDFQGTTDHQVNPMLVNGVDLLSERGLRKFFSPSPRGLTCWTRGDLEFFWTTWATIDRPATTGSPEPPEGHRPGPERETSARSFGWGPRNGNFPKISPETPGTAGRSPRSPEPKKKFFSKKDRDHRDRVAASRQGACGSPSSAAESELTPVPWISNKEGCLDPKFSPETPAAAGRCPRSPERGKTSFSPVSVGTSETGSPPLGKPLGAHPPRPRRANRPRSLGSRTRKGVWIPNFPQRLPAAAGRCPRSPERGKTSFPPVSVGTSETGSPPLGKPLGAHPPRPRRAN
ncbi:basic salivary proline-rich protein 2-like [Gopherus evgoodei]|uniref:basic salivary proline-rich protein 2-like n=1 Tax=Gopherus evgoodei TaxID=1825980 RepID=UPI0011CFB4B1|nr:basic salivary proline-rich protein 2-like [Gopherus evgoodei]